MGKRKREPRPTEAAYLMWIGASHYATTDDFVEEAVRLGTSKRIHDIAMGHTLNRPGTVIFVAHDDGEKTDCPDCVGELQCPDCRVRRRKIRPKKKELKEFQKRFEKEPSQSVKRSIAVREKAIAELQEECEQCELCAGTGYGRAGTGGSVELIDGEGKVHEWDYRRFRYWLRQPGKFNVDDYEVREHLCETCGGNGVIPSGKIVGMIVPDRIEYILRGDEDLQTLTKIGSLRQLEELALADEEPRASGSRQPGGVYAVTDPKRSPSRPALDAVENLVRSGSLAPDSAEIRGNFVRFLDPISLPGFKRFRGMRKVDPNVSEWALTG